MCDHRLIPPRIDCTFSNATTACCVSKPYDPLIFPTDQFTSKCSNQPNLTGQEEQNVTRAFEGVLNG